MQTIVDIRGAKSMEMKIDSELAPVVENSKSPPATHYDNICGADEEKTATKTEPVANSTVHVQHAHYPSNVVQTTTVLPRASSEQSKLRILTRTPAVHCLSSPPSEESEDVSSEQEPAPGVKHQSSKEGSESGPPSLCSSRDSSFDYTDSTGTDLHEFIVKTLKNPRDKKMLLKLEKDFLAFILDHRKVFLQYPPMTSYHRMIVHRVAAYFGLDHNVDPTGTCIIVNKCQNTRLPEVRFSELIREDSDEDPSPKLILKRQNSMDDSGPPERRSSRRTLADKKSKSIEEREEEYEKARARIFNHGSLSSQSSASSKEGDAIFSGSRSTSIDGENDQNGEDNIDKGGPQSAIKVLTKSSRSLDGGSSKLMQDVNSVGQTNACSTTVTTTVTDSKFDSPSDTPDQGLAGSITGAPLVAGGLPMDLAARSKMLAPTGMVPYLSPNQTGGVVWTLPEQAEPFPPGHASLFPGSAMVPPDNYQAQAGSGGGGMKPSHGALPAYFYPGPTNQGYQPPRQGTAPQQQNQGAFPAQGLSTPYGSAPNFPMYPTSRMYSQQEMGGQDMVAQQQAGTGGHGMVVANSPSSNYQELNNQLAGMSISQLDQQPQDNQMFQKQRQAGGAAYAPAVTQTYAAGQQVQYVVYRHTTGAMVAHPIPNQGQATCGYLYSSPTNSQGYTQPAAYNPQMYTPQVYSQQSFNAPSPYPGAEQTMLGHRTTGTHTPPTPPQNGSPMGTSPAGYMPPPAHIPSIPGGGRQQFPAPVMNSPLTPARLLSPYQGQQLMHMHPPGAAAQQQMYTYSQPYSVGQTRPSGVQQTPRFIKPFLDQGHIKPVEVYTAENSAASRPSPSDSPRPNISTNNQNRRTSSGGRQHGKSEGQRTPNQQTKGKQKHKRSQHKNPEPPRKHAVTSSVDAGQMTDSGSCVLEVYDVASTGRDPNSVVGDLRQSGAQIIWNEAQTPAGTSTAKATFNSPSQAEQALRTNSNPNYKLRRFPAEIPVATETHNY